jgi:hypothetical protein
LIEAFDADRQQWQVQAAGNNALSQLPQQLVVAGCRVGAGENLFESVLLADADGAFEGFARQLIGKLKGALGPAQGVGQGGSGQL